MLDFNRLARQIPGVSTHLSQEAEKARQRLELAEKLMQQATARQAELVAKQKAWRDRIFFPCAEPVEPLDTRIYLNSAPPIHTVIATDGSQISPSHHEIAYCYLINVGQVILHYGRSVHPLLNSIPEVFYKPEDLYISRKWGISTEEWLGYRRAVSEATFLAELGNAWVNSPHYRENKNQQELSQNKPVPTIAMVDGSLIYWFLESLPTEVRDRILPPILAAWQQLRSDGIPLVGYLSAPRSIESINFLRLQACPHLDPDCFSHCPRNDDVFDAKTPCQIFEPLRDSSFWGLLLQPGQRGPWWRSYARILDLYGEENYVYFCYVNVGAEIARIEVPAWVAENYALLDMALSLTITQVQKGYGYPVVLAEAHNQAVVTGGDRSRFFAVLEREMIKTGLKNVSTSYKEARKRGSIA